MSYIAGCELQIRLVYIYKALYWNADIYACSKLVDIKARNVSNV